MKDRFVTVRVTKKEKILLEKLTGKMKITLSDLVRLLLFKTLYDEE